MKFRIIPLGKGKPDPRTFGFQYLNYLKTFYVRLYFFAVYLALGQVDIAADYQRIVNTTRNTSAFSMNRHGRRRLGALSRRSHLTPHA